MKRILVELWLALAERDLFGWAILTCDLVAVLVVIALAWYAEPGWHAWAGYIIPRGWWYGRIL